MQVLQARPTFAHKLTVAVSTAACLLFLSACDADITGSRFDNLAPETQLSVRDSSLVDNLGDNERLTSTVFVAWTGVDADGFVVSFEIRFYPPENAPPAEQEWTTTASSDTLVLLPIPPGQKVANVVFEVRAIDNDGARDPTPARTVFPIQNTPPSIRLSSFEAPPDTTFSVVSFAWSASDPEGVQNLARIDVALNDSTRFESLDPLVEFITLVGETSGSGEQETVDARVFLGRGFRSSNVRLPNLRIDSDNTFYVRAVDLTDTTSTLERFSWFVKGQRSDVLMVNDFRKSSSPIVLGFHSDLLRSYLPEGHPVDTWDLSLPHVAGQGGNAPRSNALFANAEPTLRHTLALFKYIYWVSSNTTNSTVQNNLPFAANAMDLFFEQDGKLMVHTPITLPGDPAESLSNPAVLLLPLSELITFPDTLRPTLRMPTGSAVEPVMVPPGLSQALPELRSRQFIIGTLPYVAQSANTIPLYTGQFTYVSRDGRRQGPWTGPSVVASISADRRIGLFSLPMINEQTGADTFEGAGGDPDDARLAVKLILESLIFPKR